MGNLGGTSASIARRDGFESPAAYDTAPAREGVAIAAGVTASQGRRVGVPSRCDQTARRDAAFEARKSSRPAVAVPCGGPRLGLAWGLRFSRLFVPCPPRESRAKQHVDHSCARCQADLDAMADLHHRGDRVCVRYLRTADAAADHSAGAAGTRRHRPGHARVSDVGSACCSMCRRSPAASSACSAAI